MPVEPDPSVPDPAAAAPALQVTLTLTLARPGHGGWHASVQWPDHSVRDFASPFELVRYLSWPPLPERRRGGSGLR